MKYHNITKDDMLNGEGLRVVLWVSGCTHKCKNCHNEITWDADNGLLFDNDAKSELFVELEKEYINGLTLSGGDPLYIENREAVLALSKDIKNMFPTKSLWLYTGYKWEEVCDLEIMKYIDVVVDGKYINTLNESKLKWKGSSNQRVIDVKKSIDSGNIETLD